MRFMECALLSTAARKHIVIVRTRTCLKRSSLELSTALFTAASEAKLSDKASNALSTAIDAKLVAAVSADVVMTAAGTQNCANPEQWASDELVKSLKDKKKSLSVKL